MTTPEIEVRFLTPDDAAEWLRLRIEALEGDPQAFSASLEEYRALAIDDVKKRLWSTPNACVVGAFEGARLVAVAGFFRDRGDKSRHKGHVWGVYVTPAFRGKRLGRRVMQELLDHAKGVEGIEQIMLSVTAAQEGALGLYRSLGFQTWGREPNALKIRGRSLDEEHMLLRLQP